MRETTFVSFLIDVPPTDPSLATEDTSRTHNAGGFTSGLVVLIRAASRLTLAPEVRYTWGMIDDDPYRVFRVGLRTTWDF